MQLDVVNSHIVNDIYVSLQDMMYSCRFILYNDKLLGAESSLRS